MKISFPSSTLVQKRPARSGPGGDRLVRCHLRINTYIVWPNPAALATPISHPCCESVPRDVEKICRSLIHFAQRANRDAQAFAGAHVSQSERWALSASREEKN